MRSSHSSRRSLGPHPNNHPGHPHRGVAADRPLPGRPVPRRPWRGRPRFPAGRRRRASVAADRPASARPAGIDLACRSSPAATRSNQDAPGDGSTEGSRDQARPRAGRSSPAVPCGRPRSSPGASRGVRATAPAAESADRV